MWFHSSGEKRKKKCNHDSSSTSISVKISNCVLSNQISVNPKFFYISLMFVGSMAIYKQVPFKFSFVMKKRFIWIENDHPRIFLLFSCDKLWFPCKY